MQKPVSRKHHNEIELPRDKEVVTSAFYSIRVASGEAGKVEVSIDGSIWQPCRFTGDYWWYEWSDYAPGPHQIRAQFYDGDGRVLALQTRGVEVRYESLVR